MDGEGNFEGAIQSKALSIVDACTRCEKCFDVCPMAAPAGLEDADPEHVLTGVVDILRIGDGNAEGRRWAEVCSHSGFCLDACDYGVDPRLMLLLAQLSLKRDAGETAREQGRTNFQDMVRATKILPRLQLNAEDLAYVSTQFWTEDIPPDLIFYTGCNVLRTPHIALLCLDILDALELSYAVYGGPSNCCGILQLRPGDTANGGRQAYATIKRFAETGASEVVSWCPTCMVQMGETALPVYEEQEGAAGFEMSMMAVFLERHLDRLREIFVHPVKKRVALHEHPGSPGVTDAVRAILSAIPELEFVDLEQPRAGYMCNSLSALPEFRKDLHEKQLEAATDAGIDTLAGVYHACHRDICSHERNWPFEVVNFLELIGEAIGVERPDVFKRLKMLQNVDEIVDQVKQMIEYYDLDINEVRDVIAKNMVGEQSLPLKSRE
ncbi:MAG: (Fe-S)-binding protein [Alphaproteobacteria bacterium]|nr:(Fe-S)-binding protein [Alphaproteobacteria bacterium]